MTTNTNSIYFVLLEIAADDMEIKRVDKKALQN